MKYVVYYNDLDCYDDEGNVLKFDSIDEAIEFALDEFGLVFEDEEIRNYGIIELLNEHNIKIDIIG